MSLFDRSDDWLQVAPQVSDPDFGRMTFWRNAKEPERSFWEGLWSHPTVEEPLYVALPGPFAGPFPEARQFALQLASSARLAAVLQTARSRIEPVFLEWTGRELSADMDDDLNFVGIALEGLGTSPMRWELSFEVLGDEMVFISVPMLGDVAQEAYVET